MRAQGAWIAAGLYSVAHLGGWLVDVSKPWETFSENFVAVVGAIIIVASLIAFVGLVIGKFEKGT